MLAGPDEDSGVRPQVHVWYAVTERLAESAMAEARDLLSPAERARCDRFRFDRDRRDFARRTRCCVTR